jgi:UPF0716 protein FxsA
MRLRWMILAALFIVVPVLEIYVLIQIGHVIGAGWTILLLIADGILGSMLVRHEGRRAWRALTDAIGSGRMPHRELADGALVLVGGTLLLAPGFITDIAGLLCILPMTRPLVRRALTRALAGRAITVVSGVPNRVGRPRTQQRPGPDDVVQGDVVD